MKSQVNLCINEVKARGYSVLPGFLDKESITSLRSILCRATIEHNNECRSPHDLDMVHNCHEYDLSLLSPYEHPLIVDILSGLLGNSYIVYAFQSSSLPGCGGTNYARRIHVDSPRIIPNYITNIGVIITLDDYSLFTGATEFFPNTYELTELPAYIATQPLDYAEPVICMPGSAIIFNARTFHREGINSSPDYRMSLTCNFCRCYMRQRFDFIRLAQSTGSILRMSEMQRKLLGYNVRIPSNLEQFYLPESQRLYKANQE